MMQLKLRVTRVTTLSKEAGKLQRVVSEVHIYRRRIRLYRCGEGNPVYAIMSYPQSLFP